MAQSNSVLQVYGGAIVLDPGSQSTRIGYAGEDCPRIITPSYARFDELSKVSEKVKETDGTTSKTPLKKRLNTFYGESSIHYPKENSELKPIIKDGIIEDWDSAVEQWEYLFNTLDVQFDEQPLLLTEPVWNSVENKKKSLEVALETFQFPAFYLASSPACVAFALGRPSALVVDIGHDITSVTPVVDGMVLAKSTLKTHFAGHYLSTQLHNRLKLEKKEIVPLYKVKSKVLTQPSEVPNWIPKQFSSITKSYDDFQIERTLYEFKETVLKVPTETIDLKKAENDDGTFPKRKYELPNGVTIELGRDRFEIGDALFNPEQYEISEFPPESGEPEIQSQNDYVPLKRGNKKPTDDGTEAEEIEKPSAKKQKKDIPKYRGLGHLASHSLSLVDVDLRTQLANNIIVTGSSSLIPGLTDRLNQELSKAHPGLKFRIHASGNTAERKYQAWIGGSVLSSLGTFHQLWVSQKELEEVGVDRLLAQRFR
ncbi:hypothetical protein WICMUC_001129 [Wickerhamomyces mucosus]|uniref:Actin-related protein 4 n=1 Tax=Wickerhamomyces mucosus TaxID=1378264 RepID=A0A9P8PXE4_9ASCO|nr:hypothetical protein WICMUC_001129 [Wickerhamomyces mucosus]